MLWEIICGRASMDSIREWREMRAKEREEKLREKIARLEEEQAEREMSMEILRYAFSVRPAETYLAYTLVLWGFLALEYSTIQKILQAFFAFLAKVGEIWGR
jgi:uncharacterized membrane protein (DUF106 family)